MSELKIINCRRETVEECSKREELERLLKSETSELPELLPDSELEDL